MTNVSPIITMSEKENGRSWIPVLNRCEARLLNIVSDVLNQEEVRDLAQSYYRGGTSEIRDALKAYR